MNNAVQYLFGYRKNELIGKNPNIIMPRVYADNHDDIIHKFAESQMSAPNWKDKLVFGKNSLGYAFPLIINTRAIYNVPIMSSLQGGDLAPPCTLHSLPSSSRLSEPLTAPDRTEEYCSRIAISTSLLSILNISIYKNFYTCSRVSSQNHDSGWCAL